MDRRIVAIAALALVATACEAAPPADQGASTDTPPVMAVNEELAYPFDMTESQESGKVIYETVCWTCHGDAGRGDGPAVDAGSVPPPPSFYAEPVASMTADDLVRRFGAALEGDDPTHPHMRFVANLLQPDRFRDALAYVPAVIWPPEIPGSAMAGRARYEDLCMACHGEDGQGHGTAADVLVVSPAQFPSDTLIAARNWEALFRRVKDGAEVHGSSMPPWGVMLSDDEVWDLVSYIASFQRGVLSPPPGS
jgi:mono/diheme cytochrome c family protein